MQGTCDKEVKVFKLIIFSCFISDTSVLIYSFRLIKNFSSFNRNNIHELIFLLNLEGSWAVSLFFFTYHWILFHGKYISSKCVHTHYTKFHGNKRVIYH